MSMFDAFLGMKDSQSLDREVKVRGVNLEYEKPGEPAPLKSLIDRVMADDNEDGIPSQRIDGVGTTMQRRFECIVDRAKRVEQSFVFQTFITICIVVVSLCHNGHRHKRNDELRTTQVTCWLRQLG